MKTRKTAPTVEEVTRSMRPILERAGATRAGFFGEVDLVEYAAIKPLLCERILAQEVRIL